MQVETTNDNIDNDQDDDQLGDSEILNCLSGIVTPTSQKREESKEV